MEFDINKVYTAVNANELKVGDKVILANDLDTLRKKVVNDRSITCINRIAPEEYEYRFYGKNNAEFSILAYLVERAEEKKYRPYKDTAEMLADYKKRFYIDCPNYEMLLIWLRIKINLAEYLVTSFCGEKIEISDSYEYLEDVLRRFTYIDGSPCGVEEE